MSTDGSISSHGSCCKCGKGFGFSPVVTACKASWHQNCFACSCCSRALVNEKFYSAADKEPVCVDCWDKRTATELVLEPRCARCDLPISIRESVVTALNKKWHTSCHLCHACSKLLFSDPFKVKNEQTYCIECCLDTNSCTQSADVEFNTDGSAKIYCKRFYSTKANLDESQHFNKYVHSNFVNKDMNTCTSQLITNNLHINGEFSCESDEAVLEVSKNNNGVFTGRSPNYEDHREVHNHGNEITTHRSSSGEGHRQGNIVSTKSLSKCDGYNAGHSNENAIIKRSSSRERSNEGHFSRNITSMHHSGSREGRSKLRYNGNTVSAYRSSSKDKGNIDNCKGKIITVRSFNNEQNGLRGEATSSYGNTHVHESTNRSRHSYSDECSSSTSTLSSCSFEKVEVQKLATQPTKKSVYNFKSRDLQGLRSRKATLGNCQSRETKSVQDLRASFTPLRQISDNSRSYSTTFDTNQNKCHNITNENITRKCGDGNQIMTSTCHNGGCSSGVAPCGGQIITNTACSHSGGCCNSLGNQLQACNACNCCTGTGSKNIIFENPINSGYFVKQGFTSNSSSFNRYSGQNMIATWQKNRICERCGSTISGCLVNALDKSWHPECFQCSGCSMTLGDTPFHYHGQQAYCLVCWKTNFMPLCKHCNISIDPTEKYTEFHGNCYHVNCLVCLSCNVPLAGVYFLYRSGQPLCMACGTNEVTSIDSYESKHANASYRSFHGNSTFYGNNYNGNAVTYGTIVPHTNGLSYGVQQVQLERPNGKYTKATKKSKSHSGASKEVKTSYGSKEMNTSKRR